MCLVCMSFQVSRVRETPSQSEGEGTATRAREEQPCASIIIRISVDCGIQVIDFLVAVHQLLIVES